MTVCGYGRVSRGRDDGTDTLHYQRCGSPAPTATDPPTGQPKVPADSHPPGPEWYPTAYCPANFAQRRHRGPPLAPRTITVGRHGPHLLESSPDRRAPCLSPLVPTPRPSLGGFGVRQYAAQTGRSGWR